MSSKYRAIVTNIQDPSQMGRIKVQCPKLFGDYESSWCLPCVPYADDNLGMMFLPKLNDLVWIELEDNDLSKPIWLGYLWGENLTPLQDRYQDADKIRIIRVKDLTIELDESDTGGVKIYNKDNTRIHLKTDNTIEVLNSTGAGLVVNPDNSISIRGSKINFEKV